MNNTELSKYLLFLVFPALVFLMIVLVVTSLIVHKERKDKDDEEK